MSIPVKYIYMGDKYKARNLRGVAQAKLIEFKKDMKYQNLAQHTRQFHFDGGAGIKLAIVYGLTTITIYYPFTEVVEKEKDDVKTARVISEGNLLKSGSIISEANIIKRCIKQGANAVAETCQPAVKVFEPLKIAKATALYADPDYFDSFQVRGGVAPYMWAVDSKHYYFKDEEGKHVQETPGNLEPPICTGGEFHGYRGGFGGVTGVLYALQGGTVINKDVCDRGDGIYLCLGNVVLFVETTCRALLTVTDICGNTATRVLDSFPLTWNPASADVITAGQEIAFVMVFYEGKGELTWSISGDNFWFEDGDGNEVTTLVTEQKTLRLYSNEYACQATIKVEICQTICTGTVRTNTGEWVAVCNAVDWGVCSGIKETQWGPASYEIISGLHKWAMKGSSDGMTSLCCQSWSSCHWSPSDCPAPPCGSPLGCDGARCLAEEPVSSRAWPKFTYYRWGCP